MNGWNLLGIIGWGTAVILFIDNYYLRREIKQLRSDFEKEKSEAAKDRIDARRRDAINHRAFRTMLQKFDKELTSTAAAQQVDKMFDRIAAEVRDEEEKNQKKQ
jgi:biopolymer transport protein ExbB/TolQ